MVRCLENHVLAIMVKPIAQYVWYRAQEKTTGEFIHHGIIAKRTPRPYHQGRGVLFMVEGTDPRLHPYLLG